MSEEILDALAKAEGLRVVARTSSFSFKGKNADVSEIARKVSTGTAGVFVQHTSASLIVFENQKQSGNAL